MRVCPGNNIFSALATAIVYLGNRLEHGDEDEFDEADLRRRLRDFLAVHEGRHRQTFFLLAVRLCVTAANVTSYNKH